MVARGRDHARASRGCEGERTFRGDQISRGDRARRSRARRGRASAGRADREARAGRGRKARAIKCADRLALEGVCLAGSGRIRRFAATIDDASLSKRFPRDTVAGGRIQVLDAVADENALFKSHRTVRGARPEVARAGCIEPTASSRASAGRENTRAFEGGIERHAASRHVRGGTCSLERAFKEGCPDSRDAFRNACDARRVRFRAGVRASLTVCVSAFLSSLLQSRRPEP